MDHGNSHRQFLRYPSDISLILLIIYFSIPKVDNFPDTGGECLIEKSKLRYEKIAQPVSMPTLQAEIKYSRAKASFSKDIFWFKHARKEESVHLVNEDLVFIKAALSTELELRSDFDWPAADESAPLLPYREANQVQAVFQDKPKSAEELKRQFAGMKWLDAVKSYTTMLREEQAGAKHRAVTLLADYLRYQPAHTQDLKAALRDSRLGDEEQAFAVLALQIANIPADNRSPAFAGS